jgi:peroxiredoxin
MIRYAIAAVAALSLVCSAHAAKLKIGDPAPKFSGLETTDGKSISLDDLKDKDVVVVAITCNHCPVAVAYEDRFIEFAKKHCGKDSKVAMVAINVNNLEADKMPAMKERAKSKGFNFTYAYDPTQKIAKDLGATKTPEVFVFNKERRLVYMGAVDDNMKADKVTKTYLVDAVKATLKGEACKPETTPAVGCGIKFEKSEK